LKTHVPYRHDQINSVEIPLAAKAASKVRARFCPGLKLPAERAKEAKDAIRRFALQTKHALNKLVNGNFVSNPEQLMS
jgi:hypothetical protein